jgi:hypothetical protein
MHVEHVQLSPDAVEGGFIPAAAQLKPKSAAAVFFGLGASQMVHLSTAEPGFESIHSKHIQFSASVFVGGFIPAAAQLKAAGVGATPASAFLLGSGIEKSKIGSEGAGIALAALRSVTCTNATKDDDDDDPSKVNV